MTPSDRNIQVKPRTRRVGKVGGDVPCCPPPLQARLGEHEATEIATLLRALADPTRVQIVTLLAEHPGEVCVCDITSHFHLDQSTISHHLRLLREAGIINVVKHGVWSYYFLQSGVWQPILQLVRRLESCCEGS
jgi:ArsR family transcriptional regulator, arsenate/arsenite/antimonite-responsive transcriptional repressor